MRYVIILLSIVLAPISWSQKPGHGQSLSFQQHHERSAQTPTNFAVKGSLDQLKSDPDIHYKYSAGGWHHVLTTSYKVAEMLNSGDLTQIYFAPSQPQELNDTMRIVQNIDSVHADFGDLVQGFTGKDVIIGYVDTGLDYNHPDFQQADGTTRVLYYWDQSMGTGSLTPAKYGYGQVWDSTAINSGTITSMDNSAHGTTVTGTGSGNGLATGSFMGAAPESDIIIVESDFSAANWTLTVADAIDFIFSMADTLGKPAVVNTSLGTYLGSHDGLDPAGQIVDSLLNDLPGRIVVAAAGNSGAQGAYHVKAEVSADTSFCWFEVNPESGFGSEAVYFDLWADTAEFSDVEFAFGADNQSPFDFRGRTQFMQIDSLLGVTTTDSIMNSGNKLAEVLVYCEEINGLYHLELLIDSPDSSSYLYRFETHGDGGYDLWSGAWLGLSDIKNSGLPDVSEFPAIEFYHLPDTLTTIVSSWTCSPSTVTVGNFQNQWDYLDYNGDPYSSGVVPGVLSQNSSKGPNRLGTVKPDVSATGDLILSACPLWLSPSLISSNPGMLGPGGMHVRNGGTSMASPVIAGIAALYLEKCPNSTYQDFLDDLHAGAYEDDFTGTTPNFGYGYGKVDAFDLLEGTNFPVTLSGDTLICESPSVYSTIEGGFTTYEWHNGSTGEPIILNETDSVFVTVTNEKGCQSISDTLFVLKGEVPLDPMINIIGGGLITTPADSFIWYMDGAPLESSNSQYWDPDTTGNYCVEVFSADGCSKKSLDFYIDMSTIIELSQNEFVIFPNPFNHKLRIIKSSLSDISLVLTTISGQQVYDYTEIDSQQLYVELPLDHLARGVYVLTLFYDNNFKTFRVVKE